MQMGCRTNSSMLAEVLCTFLLVAPHLAAAFMLPRGAPVAKSYSRSRGSSRRRSSPNVWLLDTHCSSTIRAISEPASGAAAKRMRRTSCGIARVTPLAAASVEGESSSSTDGKGSKSTPEPVVYAQEALDRAWRSKRRIAAQGKSKPLRQRLMNAFGQTSAVFVDDRDFMEETLDNVLRVSSERQGGK